MYCSGCYVLRLVAWRDVLLLRRELFLLVRVFGGGGGEINGRP